MVSDNCVELIYLIRKLNVRSAKYGVRELESYHVTPSHLILFKVSPRCFSLNAFLSLTARYVSSESIKIRSLVTLGFFGLNHDLSIS